MFWLIVAALSAAAIASAQTTPEQIESAQLPPAPKTDFTRHDLRKVMLAWLHSRMGQAYQAVGSHDPNWDPQLETFLDRMADRAVDTCFPDWYASGTDTSAATLRALANPILKAGCDDPLFLFLRAQLLRDVDDYRGYTIALRKFAPALLASDYSPAVKWDLAEQLIKVDDRQHDADGEAKAKDALVKWFDQDMREPVTDPLDRRLKVDDLLDLFSQIPIDTRARIMTELDQPPALDKWITHMAHGSSEIAQAWEARGGGAISTVTPDGRSQFLAHLARASDELTAAYVAEPAYPEAASAMIEVAMGQETDAAIRMRQWFDRAVAAQLDHMPAWKQLLWGLRPRWYGSHEAMYALGVEAASTRRFDTAVPQFLLTTLTDIAHDTFGSVALNDYHFFNSPDVWKRVEEVFDGYLAKPFPHMNVALWKSNELAFAYRCEQYDEAIKLLDSLNGKVIATPLADLDIDNPSDVTIKSFAMTSDVGSQVKAACELQDGQNYEQAAEAFKRITDKINNSSTAWLFVRRSAYINQILADLAAGKAVTVPIGRPSDQDGWTGDLPSWDFKDTIHVALSQSSNTQITLAVPLPANSHTITRFEWSYSDPTPSTSTRVVCAFDAISQKNHGPMSLVATPSEHKIHIGTMAGSLGDDRVTGIALEPGVWHQWTIDQQGDRLTVTSDDKTAFSNLQSDWFKIGRPMVGFGLYCGRGGASLQIRNLTIESHPLSEQ